MNAERDHKSIFERYGGMMRTKDLREERIYYYVIQQLIEDGCVEKVRYGYYRWNEPEALSEVGVIMHLFPDAILCTESALFYYGYIDQMPQEWHLAVSKDSNKSRFSLEQPPVRPHFYEPALYELGLSESQYEGQAVRIYDRERVICDCIRFRKKMDRSVLASAIRCYVNDPEKNIPRLESYAKQLRAEKPVRDFVELWL